MKAYDFTQLKPSVLKKDDALKSLQKENTELKKMVARLQYENYTLQKELNK